MSEEADAASTSGPTALRILLGTQLRKLREARGITREDAGWHIRASESKISRMELGRVGFKVRDITDLLTFYGVEDEQERTQMLNLARQANEPGWWHQYSDVYPAWLQSFLGLESAASLIRTYEVQFVPGLLQTEEYARAVILLAHANKPPDEIKRRIALRMTRQQILTRSPSPPHYWAVIDEGALRRMMGGATVMKGQLAALMEVSKLPNVTLQVIPFSYGGHSVVGGGAFTILRFPDRDLPDVVYLEQLNSALYLDRPEDVEEYATVMERLAVEADPPARTPKVLEAIMQDIDRQV